MSTKHLFLKRDVNAIKRQDRRMGNHKNWSKEKQKMKNLTNKYLLEQELKGVQYVFVFINMRLYSVVSDMLSDSDFTCLDKEANEFTFEYSEIERIEK